MDGFNFYERPRTGIYEDNVFFKGTAVTNGEITPTYVESKMLGAITKNFRLENGIIKGFIYKNNSGNYLIESYAFSELSALEIVVIENRGLFNINDVNGFEFMGTVIDYAWMPYIYNNLGRQCFQDTRWGKRAYFPYVKNLGRRSIYASNLITSSTLRIYTPSCVTIELDSFVFQGGTAAGRFSHAILYLDSTIWDATKIANTVGLQAFLNSGGTLKLIQDYTKPTTPSDLVVTNITSSSIKVDFNVSTFTNAFGWYEVFCVIDNNPASRYFHHKEITSNSATITDLPSGTLIEVKVRAADEYMNLSNFGNSVFITTL